MARVKRGDQVETSDGYEVGTVITLTADEHFVVRHKDDWEVTLPETAVERIEDDTVYLALDEEALKKLPLLPVASEDRFDEYKVEMVVRVFDDPDKAAEALEFVKDLRNRKVLKLLNAAVLVKDEDGKLSIEDVKEFEPKEGRIWGAITGGLVGLLAGPVGVVVGALAGLGVGGLAGRVIDRGFSNEFLENLDQYVQPGTSALILLIEHHWVRPASEAMEGLGGVVLTETLTDTLVKDLLEAQEE